MIIAGANSLATNSCVMVPQSETPKFYVEPLPALPNKRENVLSEVAQVIGVIHYSLHSDYGVVFKNSLFYKCNYLSPNIKIALLMLVMSNYFSL